MPKLTPVFFSSIVLAGTAWAQEPRATFPAVAPDYKTAQCIFDKMDDMFDAGVLKDQNPPEKSFYTYSLKGKSYKAVVSACEKQTGQKTLYPESTGATTHRPKPCLPNARTIYPQCQ